MQQILVDLLWLFYCYYEDYLTLPTSMQTKLQQIVQQYDVSFSHPTFFYWFELHNTIACLFPFMSSSDHISKSSMLVCPPRNVGVLSNKVFN
jgi:hypothetical protein